MSMNTDFRRLILGSIALLPAWLCGVSARADTILAQSQPAQGKAVPSAPPASAEKRDLSALFPPPVVSRQSIGQGAAKLSYTATAATLPLPGPKGSAAANIFHVAYTLEDGNARRPITFVFNGGPGAASAFLHLGAMGPRAVNFEANGAAPVAPVALADNSDTWLGFTDLVFIDPVATGYSRSTAGTEEGDRAYFGVEKDRDAMADFVRLYLTRTGRLLAPVFLVGESYGGFRAGLVAEKLLSGGIGVKGVVLVSPALEFSMLRHNPYVLLPQALVLPSIAATHLELRDGPQGSLDLLAEVERFAREKYLVHMAAGLKNDPDIEAALARYTGLPADVIRSHYGRVSVRTFAREHQTRRDRVLSRYDGVVSTAVPRRSERHFDPILDGATAVLAPAFTQYARGELGYRTDLTYELLNRSVSGNWDYGTSPTRQGFAGALDELQKARTHNPGLGVLITHGYTDLVTPYFVSRYLIDQLAPIDKARPIELKVYRGGHMMYLRPASRAALGQDARAFYEQLSKPASKGP
jgi:carboxypeptidase C (cathepsin A)